MNRIVRVAIATCAVVLGVRGQTSRGTVTGLVTDPSTAVVGSARVEVRNSATGVSRSAVTNGAGIYRFDAVDPGSYEISIDAAGFKTAKTSPFDVAAAQVASVDIKLEVGERQTTVDITAESAQLQTDSPVRSATLDSKQIDDLPFVTRNPASLALIVPGVSTSRFGVGGVGSFSSDGARNRSNNFLIDGTENNDISVEGQAFTITLPDLVQETRVQTTNFDAEFGRAGGAVVNVITKSGGNEFHGTASWLLDVTNDDAITNTERLNAAVLLRGRPLPGTDNIWAGTLGGPIVHNRTFFYAGFQENHQLSSGSGTLPAPPGRGLGDTEPVVPAGRQSRVDLYRQVLAGTTATAQFADIALGNGRSSRVATIQRGFQPFLPQYTALSHGWPRHILRRRCRVI